MNQTSASARPAAPGPRQAVTVVLVYACFAALWILLSDQLVDWLLDDPALILLVSTVKGLSLIHI